MQKLGNGHGAVGSQDQLGSLDLHLEPEPTGGQPVRLFQSTAHLDHGRDLGDVRDLGQRQHQACWQLTAAEKLGQEEVQGAQATPPGRCFETLEPKADEARRLARNDRRSEAPSRGHGIEVLVGSPIAVAVLEIEPDVFDGL